MPSPAEPVPVEQKSAEPESAGHQSAGQQSAGQSSTGPKPLSRRRTLLGGGAWSVLGQLVPAAGALVLTPYVIHGFGLERYGLFILCTTITRFIGSFDGGLGSSAGRFFGMQAGVDDRRGSARLLVSVTLILAVAGALFATLFVFVARPLTYAFKMSDALRGEAAFMLRVLVGLVFLGILQGLLASVLQVRGRFALVQSSGTVFYGVYIIGVVVAVHGHHGLRGLALALAAQQVLGVVVLVIPVYRLLDFSALTLYTRSELRTFFSYAGKVQLVGLASLFAVEVDAVLIGAALSVRDVGLYAAGVGLATQLRSLPANFLGPISIIMARAFGRGGDAEAQREFVDLQRTWVVASTLWCVTATASAWFALTAWLGSGFSTSGYVALILLLGVTVNLWTGPMTSLMGIVGRPGLEAQYSMVSVVLNVACTVPFVFLFGVLGVVSGTTIGGIVGSVYLLRLVHRKYDPGLRGFLHEVPIPAALVCALVTVAGEALLHPFVPHGAGGLLACGGPALIGLLTGALVSPEGRSALQTIRSRIAPSAARAS